MRLGARRGSDQPLERTRNELAGWLCEIRWRQRYRSSTSRIFPPSVSEVNGLFRNAIPVLDVLASSCWNSTNSLPTSGRDPDAGVLDIDAEQGRTLGPDPDGDPPARRGELDRIRQVVVQNLLHTWRVGDDGGDFRIHLDLRGDRRVSRRTASLLTTGGCVTRFPPADHPVAARRRSTLSRMAPCHPSGAAATWPRATRERSRERSLANSRCARPFRDVAVRAFQQTDRSSAGSRPQDPYIASESRGGASPR